MINLVARLIGITMLTIFLSNCYATTIGNPSPTYFYNEGKSSFSANGFEPSDVEGEACSRSIFALVAIGDSSIEKAANTVSIKNIRSVTHKFYPNWFGLHTFCTIVRGTR